MSTPELLAPANDLSAVRTAIDVGADAIYVGLPGFNLRAKVRSLSIGMIETAMRLAHKSSRRLYVALNVGPRDSDFGAIEKLLLVLKNLEVDALILWDPGVLWSVRQIGLPHRLHLSTMSCTLNARAVTFWGSQGISRVNIARELTYDEVAYIKRSTQTEIEVFVHGSMCIAYAGRCVLSNYLRNRDTHRGFCSTPCRWQYRLLVAKAGEDFRELPLHEDGETTYILNSKNLCLIHRLPELLQAGLDSFKIEGRQHDSVYVRDVVGVYRSALDRCLENPTNFTVTKKELTILKQYGQRGYWEGFMFETPDGRSQNFSARGPSAKKLRAQRNCAKQTKRRGL